MGIFDFFRKNKTVVPPINYKPTNLVRVANNNEIKNHIVALGGKSFLYKKATKDMLILRYNYENSYSNEKKAPIYSTKLYPPKDKNWTFESMFDSLKGSLIYNIEKNMTLEGEVICIDTKSLNEWKITGDLSNEIKEHKFKHIEYKWFHINGKDDYGTTFNNIYLIRTIQKFKDYLKTPKPVEYHVLFINSENDLRIEDIFEDIGF